MINSGVRHAVVTYGPDFTQTTVALEKVEISPLSGSGRITGFEIGNPQGYSDKAAFKVEDIEIKVSIPSIIGDHIVIERIYINRPAISYETNLRTNNLKVIQDNINAAIGAAEKTPAKENSEPSNLKVEVKEFVLENAQISLSALGTGTSLPMPTIRLTNIGSIEGGVTPDQIVSAVFNAIMQNVAIAVRDNAGELLKGGSIKDAGKKLKGLFGGNKDEK